MAAKTDALTDLDKFKRRMIRTVARLLVKENKPEDEVFQTMQQETGCNCRLLWNRMRALTTKKLQRLLKAEDRSENIASVGRMSLTDWLLFDLVIVHEDIDVIGKDIIMETKKDSKPMLELFVLVQRFNIEVRNADSLAEAWTAATIMYNSMGHQCSPMLMQRRWYQLKQLTRELFYNYWFTYRGAPTRLSEANKFQPTKLQRAIAQRFPDIILTPFMTWEEMIKNDLVIMPEVFEEKMRRQSLPKPIDESSVDIVIVEPEVETIDLGDDSDSERQEDSQTNVEQVDKGPDEGQSILDDVKKVKIKTEKEDEDPEDYFFTREDNIQEREREVIASIENAELALDSENMNHAVNHVIDMAPNVTNEIVDSNIENISKHNMAAAYTNSYEKSDENFTNSSSEDVPLPTIINVIGNVDMSEIPNESSNISDPEIQSSVEENQFKIIDLVDDIMETTNIKIEKEDINESLNIKNVIENLKTINQNTNKKFKPILNIQCKKAIEKSLRKLKASFEANTEDNELEMEAAKKANDYMNNKTNKDIQSVESCDFEMEISKKADMFIKSRTEKRGVDDDNDDVVVTDLEFTDDGVEFIDDGIEFEDYDGSAINENSELPMPILKSEEINASDDDDELEMENVDTGKFDLKLLMDPVVYTLKLDDMEVLRNKPIQTVKSDNLIKEIDAASKIVSPKSSIIKIKEENAIDEDKEIYDDIFRHDFDENLEAPVICENKRLKLTSYLLNKPKIRDYNFIQLCKNPDFNTRLKRLHVGFFSSSRNRELLKACKPLTIDVSKAFEQKLIDGTLYLKEDTTTQPDASNCSNDYVPSNVNIRASTITSQSLFDGLVTNMLPSTPFHKEPNMVIERNTVINLPNINEIRRINQKLLTAEVLPIQINANCNKDIAISNCADDALNKDNKIVTKLPENSTETQNLKKPQDHIKSRYIEETTKNTHMEKQNDNINPDSRITDTNSQAKTSSMKPYIKQKIRARRPTKYPVVSWLNRQNDIINLKDDALITLDTLKKMINVMEGNTLPAEKKSTGTSQGRKKKSNVDNKSTDTNKVTDSNKVNNSNESIDGNKATGSNKATKSKKVIAEHQNSENNPESKIATPKINLLFSSDSYIPKPYKKRNKHKSSYLKKDNNAILDKDIDCAKQPTSDILFLDNDDIALNMVYSNGPGSSMYTNDKVILPPTSNNTEQLTISEPVNHILIETPNIVAMQKVTCDVSTTTSEPEVPSRLSKTVSSNPIFTVLPSPTTKHHNKSKSLACLKSKETYFGKMNVDEDKSCSCLLPIVNSTQKHIILDGSNYCGTHGPQQSKNNNKTMIPQNIFQRIMSESSLKLSKDKILLSTVTFPKTNILHEGVPDLSAKVLSSTPLPPGVQLILPSNGQLTYTIQPGVVLEEHQIAQLHTLIEAIKLQLPSKPVSIPAQPICISNEVVDLTDDDLHQTVTQKLSSNFDNNDAKKSEEDTAMTNTSTAKDLDQVGNVTSADNALNIEHRPITNEINDINWPNVESTTEDSNIETIEKSKENSAENIKEGQSETNTTIELSSCPTTVLIEQIDTNNINDHNSVAPQLNATENDVPSNSRSRVEENNKNILSNVPENDVSLNNRKSILSDLMEISGIGEEDVAPMPEEPPSLVPIGYTNPIVINLNTGNLNIAPITSFKELKYAYENNALFFELNCVTGIIQKVNVCVSKSTVTSEGSNKVPPTQAQNLNLPPLVPTVNKNPVPQVQNKAVNSRTKPIIIRKLQKLKSVNFKELKKMKASLLKPNLSNVRKALLRSKVKLYEKHQLSITLDITNDDSDSSDDEPLIKKARRMKEIREKDDIHSENKVGNEIMESNDQEISSRMEEGSVENHESLPCHDSGTSTISNEVSPNQKTITFPENGQPESDDVIMEKQVVKNFILENEIIENRMEEQVVENFIFDNEIIENRMEEQVVENFISENEIVENIMEEQVVENFIPENELIEEDDSSSEECILGV